MATVTVKRHFDAPIEAVFDAYTDHASWSKVPMIRSAKVVKQGVPAPNGLGAIREISTPFAFFREEITVWERPTRMDYQIRYVRPKFTHDNGTVRFTEDGNGTLITWTSTFHSDLPIIGPALGPLGMAIGTTGFKLILRTVAQELDRAKSR